MIPGLFLARCLRARLVTASLSLSAVFILLLAAATCLAGSVSPQTIIAALRSKPGFLPMIPNSVRYARGSEATLSQYDQKHGVIAYFTLAANYEDASATSGIGYRVFTNNAAAEDYWGEMSAANNDKIMNALGSDISEDIHYDVKTDWPWRGRQPFKDMVCETYISTKPEHLATARCYAQHLDLPVVVSGIRVVQVSATLTEAEAKQQFGDAERKELTKIAASMLCAGMARVEAIETDGQ
jgi:hypothetical protein